jgi:hypothetical protein
MLRQLCCDWKKFEKRLPLLYEHDDILLTMIQDWATAKAPFLQKEIPVVSSGH